MVRDLDAGSLRQALLGLFQVPVKKKAVAKPEGKRRDETGRSREETGRPSMTSVPPPSPSLPPPPPPTASGEPVDPLAPITQDSAITRDSAPGGS
jgi:hypothetical protein